MKLDAREYWWGGIGLYTHPDGREERLLAVALPVFGYAYSINYDDDVWSQRMLIYRGHSGLHLGWRPVKRA